MKNLFFPTVIIALLISCSKNEKKESIGYCTYFIQPLLIKKLVEFSNTGVFIREETVIKQEGNHEDSTGSSHSVSTGCECEAPE